MSLALYSVQYNHYVIAESAAIYQTHPLGPTIVDEKYQTAQTKFSFSSYSFLRPQRIWYLARISE